MERLKKIGLILFIFILSSCSATHKFNKEIIKLDKENNLNNLKVNKKFLRTINDKLKKTNHIFYKIRPMYSYNSVFEGWDVVIFDENNNKMYNLDCDSNLKNFQLSDTIYDYDKKYNHYVYELFKNGSCDTLKKIAKFNNSSSVSVETFYEINLKTGKNKVCEFEEILYFLRLYEEN